MRSTIILLFSCLTATWIFGDELEPVLIPIVAYEVSGAYGSIWSTHLVVHNGSDRTISFDDDLGVVTLVCVGVPCLQPPPLSPGESAEISPMIDIFGAVFKPNRLLYLRRELRDQVTFSLRVQDTSRALETWGTSIPVVRETNLVEGPIVLLDIPLTGPFRQSLRIYAPRSMAADCEVVTVRVFDLTSGSTVAMFETILTDENGLSCEAPGAWPNSVEVHDLSSRIPAPAPAARGSSSHRARPASGTGRWLP